METFRRLLGYVAPYRGKLGVAVASMAIVGLCVASLTFVITDTYNVVFQDPQVTKAPEGRLSLVGIIQELPVAGSLKRFAGESPRAFLPLFIVFLAAFKGLFSYVASSTFRGVGLRVVRDLRNELFAAIHRQSLRFFGEVPTGALMSRIMSDVERIQSAVAEKVGDILQELLTLLLLVASLVYIDAQLSAYALLVVPPVVIPIVRFGRKLRRVSRQSQERTGELASILHESIYGVRIVKAFGMEPFEIRRFRQANDRLLLSNLRAVRADALTGPVIEVVGSVAAATFLAWAAHRIAAGRLTPGDFGGFLYALYRCYLPAKKLSSANNVIQQALAAAQRVFDIIDQESDVVEKAGAPALPPMREGIRFEDVAFAYPRGGPVLQGVSLSVRAGEVVAVVGRTGEGKTTLVNLLPRFHDVTGGRLLVDGRDVRDVSVASLREQIAIVTQETILFNDTVRNNIAYGRPDTAQEAVEAAARAAYAHDFVTGLPQGYDTVIGERGARLSGGERQRIAIARAILKDPPILILDEATSALDSESEVIVQRALANLMEGRTVFMIAHRLQTVRSAHRIVALEGGRVRESGSHDDLMALGGLYARLHQMQFSGAAVAAVGAGEVP